MFFPQINIGNFFLFFLTKLIKRFESYVKKSNHPCSRMPLWKKISNRDDTLNCNLKAIHFFSVDKKQTFAEPNTRQIPYKFNVKVVKSTITKKKKHSASKKFWELTWWLNWRGFCIESRRLRFWSPNKCFFSYPLDSKGRICQSAWDKCQMTVNF